MTKAQKVAAELTLQKAKYDFELAQSKLNSLEKYSKPLAVKRLTSEIDKAHSQEQAAKEISELRQSQVERTRRQIENCKLKAPSTAGSSLPGVRLGRELKSWNPY